ncbi:MAG: peptidase PmbA [Candidatus Bathyarchaeota archaeon BA1]|nr:MAG: peptidase PmbA [Candidatus Bathyarchaeota archaeon BA1]
MSLQDFTELAIRQCGKLGADEAEAFAQKQRIIEVVLERGELQSERVKFRHGIGIRLIKEKKLGFAFSSTLSKRGVLKTCGEAFSLARASTPNPDWFSLPTPTKLPGPPAGIFDKEVAALGGDEVLSLAVRAYDAVKEYDKRAVIDDGKFSSAVTEVAISNSHEINAAEKSTLLYCFMVCVAKECGEVSSMAFEYDVARTMKFSPEKIGRLAAEKAVASLRPKTTSPFVGQVILDSLPAAEIVLSPVIASVNADNVQRRRSIWMGKLGERVADPQLSVVDDGLLPSGIGSSSFDAEGVSRQRTQVIAGGLLKGYLHNSFTANKEGRSSTGNASRPDYTAPPLICVSNFVVEPGKKKLEDIISEVEKGIIVRRFSGNVRPESGEFSGIAKQASFIENGEVKYPLKETMISGNAFQALINIIEIGSEGRPTLLNAYVPPILLDKISIVSK